MDVLTDYVLDTHWLACWDCENPTVWRLCPWKKWPPVSGSGEPSHLSTPGHDLHMFTLNIYMYYYQNIHCNLTLKNNLNLLKLKLSPLPNMHEHPLNLHKRKAYEYNINTFYQITNTNFHHICISTGNVSSWGRQILKELFWRGFPVSCNDVSSFLEIIFHLPVRHVIWSPVSASNKMAVLSHDAVMTWFPSIIQSAATTTPVCPVSSIEGVLSVAASQACSTLSARKTGTSRLDLELWL